jgi:hypothetical protein
MRQTFCVVAGVVFLITLTGCGETTPEAGPVPFKATTSPAIDALRENMSKNAKNGVYTKKQTEAEPKAADAKPADVKAATDKEKDAAKKP